MGPSGWWKVWPRRMLGFLRRNKVPLTSGSLLLVSLLLLSVSARSRQFHDPVARLLADALAPLQATVIWVGIGARGVWTGYVQLVAARHENQVLRERVATLEQQAVVSAELEQANRRLSELLDFRARFDGVTYSARVIGRDPLPWFRTLTVDRGERDGIRKGMAVLSPQGVVGQIVEVSYTVAQVLVLTDHNSGIDAVVQRSRARGIVQGGLEEGCQMKYLRRGEDVTVGDRVVTSGLDGIFPKGLIIGEVVDVSLRNRGLLQMAVVQPTAPLDRIEEVLIVDATTQSKEAIS